MNIQIKNISSPPATLTFSGGLIIESQSIASGVTKSIGSPYYEFWADTEMRDYVNTDKIEVYIGGELVHKVIAMAFFDKPQYNSAITPPKEVTANYTASTNDLFINADVAANAGALSVTLAAVASYNAGTVVSVRQKTAGLLTVVAPNIIVDGVAQSNINSRTIGNVIQLYCTGTNWIKLQESEVYGQRNRARKDANLRVVASLFPAAPINNWNIFSTYPDTNTVVIGSVGNTPVNGMIPPDPNVSTEITFIVVSGTFTFNNNNAGSSAANRFQIGGNEVVSTLTTKSITFVYSPTLQRWLIKK